MKKEELLKYNQSLLEENKKLLESNKMLSRTIEELQKEIDCLNEDIDKLIHELKLIVDENKLLKIEMAKSELRLAGIEYKPEYLAFLYNAGLGNLKGEKGEYITKEEFEERLNIWKGWYNYYQKFNRVYNMI